VRVWHNGNRKREQVVGSGVEVHGVPDSYQANSYPS